MKGTTEWTASGLSLQMIKMQVQSAHNTSPGLLCQHATATGIEAMVTELLSTLQRRRYQGIAPPTRGNVGSDALARVAIVQPGFATMVTRCHRFPPGVSVPAHCPQL